MNLSYLKKQFGVTMRKLSWLVSFIICGQFSWYGVVCSVLWCGVLYGMIWYGMVWYGMVWYGMVWYGMVWYGMVWYGMVWYGMVCVVWYVGVHRISNPAGIPAGFHGFSWSGIRPDFVINPAGFAGF